MLRELDLSDDEVPVIAAMVNYLYSGDYDDSGADRFQHMLSATSFEDSASVPNTSNEASPLLFNAKMYIAAGKYNIQVLKELATEKLRNAAMTEWDNDVFMESVKLIWGETSDDEKVMRKIMGEIAVEQQQMLGENGKFKKLLPEEGTLARWMLEAGHTPGW
jgi:hypothetical protein